MGLRTYWDRVFPWTVVYAGLLAAAWNVRPWVSSELVANGLLITATLFYTHKLYVHLLVERRISSRGAHAPVLRTFTPFNIGFLFKALYYFTTHRNHVLWEQLFRLGKRGERYTVESVTFGQRIILTIDPENTKAVLATQFGDFGKGPQFREEWKDFLGLSIFTTDHEQWHDSRQLLRPQFIKDRVSDLQTFEHHVQILLPMLAGSHNGATVRVDDLIYRFTLDAATDFLLGASVDSMQNGEVEFAQAFAEIQRVQSIITRAGPIRDFIPKKSFHQSLVVLNRFIDRYIDKALALSPEELEKNAKSDDDYTFLHAIATYTRDRQVLRDQLVAVLLAGRDTTAVTLSWLFYELSKQPAVVRKLRQEILDHVGVDRLPTYDDIKAMRYLNHAINETLRLYPVVPYNVRVALKDCTLPTGGGPDGLQPIGVTEGTPIGYSPFVMQRRQDIYPSTSSGFPDPLQFVPERWDGWTPKSWSYIPFNGGPRICIGQQFALTEIAYTVTRILQTYERVEDRNPGFPGLRADIVLQPTNGVSVAFVKGEKA